MPGHISGIWKTASRWFPTPNWTNSRSSIIPTPPPAFPSGASPLTPAATPSILPPIIEGLSEKLYESVKFKVEETIENILSNNLDNKIKISTRFEMLNRRLSEENKKYIETLDNNILCKLKQVFNILELWYYYSALKDFTIEEQVKILLMVNNSLKDNIEHLSFEKLMRSIYLEYKNKKEINLYKKRIIE